MPPARRRRTMDPSDSTREEGTVVGIMFLYGIWVVLAIGAIWASALAFREHD